MANRDGVKTGFWYDRRHSLSVSRSNWDWIFGGGVVPISL